MAVSAATRLEARRALEPLPLLDYVWRKPGKGWLLLVGLGLAGTGLLTLAVVVTVAKGIGMWGNNIPVAWAFGIINFVWWIGIGHAGTLISAILLLFWYLGLIPDLAALRDSSTSRWMRRIYGILSFGWRGSARHWHHYKIAYLLLAGLATPLVLSVHTIVSYDFAVSVVPGWHETIFPPYFVAGAVFSGFAMVMTLMVPARRYLRLKHVVTARHLEAMCKIMLTTSLIVGYGYLMEHFLSWYSGNPYDFYQYANRRGILHGPFKSAAQDPYIPIFWLMVFCNVVVPSVFWSKWGRTNVYVMWIAAIFINIGMWCERFVIVVISLHRDYLPSSWALYKPTWVDLSLLTGTICFFALLFLLFLKFLPAVAVQEVKELRHELHREHERHEIPEFSQEAIHLMELEVGEEDRR